MSAEKPARYRLTCFKRGQPMASLRMSDDGVRKVMGNDADRVLALKVGDTFVDSDKDKWSRVQ